MYVMVLTELFHKSLIVKFISHVENSETKPNWQEALLKNMHCNVKANPFTIYEKQQVQISDLIL